MRYLLGLTLGCLWLVPLAGWAQAAELARDSAVKAAFLYKFVGFVEWPAGTFARDDDPFVIVVAGDDEVAAELAQQVVGRTVGGRPLKVGRHPGMAPGAPYHVLFVGASRAGRVREVIAAAHGPVLTVTEHEAGHRLGGVLNFVTEGGQVRFTASLSVARARELRLSARLLAVAQQVEGR